MGPMAPGGYGGMRPPPNSMGPGGPGGPGPMPPGMGMPPGPGGRPWQPNTSNVRLFYLFNAICIICFNLFTDELFISFAWQSLRRMFF